MSKVVEGGQSAMWDKEVTNIFCDLCIKEIELGNRPTTYFNKEGWNSIGKRFKELTGRDYDRLKFKNKWDQLKKEWKIWKELKRGSTGLGWDPIKRTIDAPAEWWAEKLEAVPAAKKYKQCGIEPEFEAKLDIMFRWVVATGKFSYNPIESGFTGIPDEITPDPVTPDEEVQSINQRDMGESSTILKRPRIAKKNKEKEHAVNTAFDRLIEAFAAPPISEDSILDCLRLLGTIPEVVANKRFHAQCVKKLEDSTRMKIFLALAPELRLEYLRVLVEE
ncbi:L10-interacting MYB domain-containing protein-like [Phalaenopsis equestris]|uniref:L10-interacting MYB domain-containing protein-like n=1 Tax=Phalaenopsis equestris TaxID=78828 RepID=UPI0009E25809|nr:L10-interacting MYB domain-containing protein-like [Phalaenopsis equestris]XP_020583774.1 L10-interacting MYB domain-containing protein-like [Phalaenopsis equestris]